MTLEDSATQAVAMLGFIFHTENITLLTVKPHTPVVGPGLQGM